MIQFKKVSHTIWLSKKGCFVKQYYLRIYCIGLYLDIPLYKVRLLNVT